MPRRVGTETSKTRAALLDGTEQLMLEQGYAAVSYRRVAAAAGVTAGLVQYYFPSLDDLFVGLLRRHTDHNLDRLVNSLAAEPERPLHVIWKYSSEETTAALMVEFMALANHRKAIRAEIAITSERSRQVQIEALSNAWDKYGFLGKEISPSAAFVMLEGIPKIVLLEGSLDITDGHTEIVTLVERYLERAEPKSPSRSTSSKATSTGITRRPKPSKRSRQAG